MVWSPPQVPKPQLFITFSKGWGCWEALSTRLQQSQPHRDAPALKPLAIGVCICMQKHAYALHAYAYICMHMHTYACICTRMQMHAHACICMHMYACACICMHRHAYACVCTHIHAYVCICVHMHAYACICMHVPGFLVPTRTHRRGRGTHPHPQKPTKSPHTTPQGGGGDHEGGGEGGLPGLTDRKSVV